MAKVLEHQISPSNEYSGLISFRIDWFDLLALQGTLKSLLQDHNPTLTSIHNYWKTIILTLWTFFSKVMSLLFNTLPRFVIPFLPRNKHLLISLLQSLSTVILEPKKIKYVTVSMFSPSICHEMIEPDAMMLVF